MFVCEHAYALRNWERTSDELELESRAFESLLPWALGSEPGPSEGVVPPPPH